MVTRINKKILLPIIEGLVILIVIGFIFVNKQNIINDYCVSKMAHNDNPLRYVCRLNSSLLKDNKALNVQSGDRVYLVFNLKKILASPLGSHDFVTGQSITNVNLKDGQICLVVYPALVKKYMLEDNQQAFDNFYKNYKWLITPTNILQTETSSLNSICTKRGDLTKLDNFFIDLNIPTKQYLSLASLETFSYGMKLLFVPNNLLGSVNTNNEFYIHYNQMIPFYLYKQQINIGL